MIIFALAIFSHEIFKKINKTSSKLANYHEVMGSAGDSNHYCLRLLRESFIVERILSLIVRNGWDFSMWSYRACIRIQSKQRAE